MTAAKKKILMSFAILSVSVLLAAGSGYADGTSAIDELQKEFETWIGRFCVLGFALGGGAWLIDILWPDIKWLDHLLSVHKRKMIYIGAFLLLIGVFKAEISEIFVKLQNPMAMFKGE